MKSKTWVVGIALALGVLGSHAALADRDDWRGHGRVGIGLSFGAPFYADPWFYGPYYPHYYSPYYYPPVVITPAPPITYIEQGSSAATTSTPQSGYWYYCEASRGYYPYVKTCPAGWLAVAPEPQQ